ncbi:Uncharacterised protein [uncultured archaeon]|nr:Uncharacterised protein [uncultured archaeon]
MKRKRIFAIIMFILILNLFLIIGSTAEDKKNDPNKTFEEKKQQLNNMGFDVGKGGVNPDNFQLSPDKKSVTILKNGASELIDVAKIKDKLIIKIPDGAILKDATGNEYHLPKDNKELTVLNGKIISDKDITLGSESKINNVKINTKNDETVSMNQDGVINTKGKEAVLTGSDGKIIGKINGRAQIQDPGSILLKSDETGTSKFTNYKGSIFEVSSNTMIYTKESSKINSAKDFIKYNGDLLVSVTNHENQIKISANDKDYGNIVVRELPSSASVSLDLKREVNGKSFDVLFQFSEKPPIVKGNIEGLGTNIATLTRETSPNVSPFMIYNGKEISEKVGVIGNMNDFGGLSKFDNPELKKLFVESMSTKFFSSDIEGLTKVLGKNSELEGLIVDRALRTNEVNSKFENFNSLMVMARNNPEEQLKLVKAYEGVVDYNQINIIMGNVRSISNVGGYSNLDISEIAKNPGKYSQIDKELDKQIDEMKSLILDNVKIDGVPDNFNRMSDEERKQALENSKFYSAKSLKTVLDYLQGNSELQDLVAKNTKLSENNLALDEGGFRQLISLSQNPDLTKQLLSLATYKDPSSGFDTKKMSDIYSSQSFVDLTKSMDSIDRWSTAQSIYRNLDINGMGYTDSNINQVGKEIISINEDYSNRLVADSKSKVIIATNPEFSDQTKDLTQGIIKAGVKQENLVSFEGGGDSIKKILDNIENTNDGLIYFNNHGNGGYQVLGKPNPDGTISPDQEISYKQLGDSLIKSAEKNNGDLSKVTVLLDSCYSYDFAKNLYNYISENGKVEQMPVVVTSTNRGQVGFSGLAKSIGEEVESGKGITLGNINSAGKKVFSSEDMSIFVPTKKGVTAIGSSNDQDKTIKSKPSSSSTPSYIQVSQLDSSIQQELSYS